MNQPAQLFEPIVQPNYEYPAYFRLTVPETNASALQRVWPPDPKPQPWRSLADFCVPENTPNPLYKGLRILPLRWRLHFRSYGSGPLGGIGGAPAIEQEELVGPAIDLGKALGIDLSPRAQGTDAVLGTSWSWTRPTDGEWSEYEFCAAFAANAWRVPHEGGYNVHINFMGTDEKSWSYLIGGATRGLGGMIPAWGSLDVGEMVWYLLVHRADQEEALHRGLGGVFAPPAGQRS